jgi:DNA-binding transcriptional LysR family regulator
MKGYQLQEPALRYFLEVVRCGSLAKASARLYVASSALSRQIAALEETLGTPLFDRRSRGMVPNAAGELLAAYARRSSLDAQRTLEEIQALQGLRSGKVSLAASAGFVGHLLPALIAGFRQRYPGVVFSVELASTSMVIERVKNGAADLGLAFSRAAERDIKVEYRQPAPVMAIMRPDHPLAGVRQLMLRRLAEYPLALPAADTTLRQLLDIASCRQQLLLDPVLTSNSMAMLQGFVLHEGGISVSAEISVRQQVADGLLVAVPIRDRGLDLRDIEVLSMSGRTLPLAVTRFVSFLREALPPPFGDLSADMADL